MRPNKFGIRGMKGVWLKGRFVYFWMPPVSLQKAGYRLRYRPARCLLPGNRELF
jgi:hypothetical protein